MSALLARSVDGIVAVPCCSNAELFTEIQHNGMPPVLVDRYLPDAQSLADVPKAN